MEKPLNPSAEILLEVPFHDVDMMGVVWHGHYYKYFELARTALFRKFQCDTNDLLVLGMVLPVIESRCRYLSPLTYGMRRADLRLLFPVPTEIITLFTKDPCAPSA